jgi:IS605 OrfB family transposase
LLRRLSGRERRFQEWLNHNIGKQLVTEAKQVDTALAFEDLTGIRDSLNQKPRSKTERRRTNNWAFYQLRIFVNYKAAIAGVPVVFVPPAYTSQTCVRFVLEKLRNERIPGSNRVTFGLSSHFKPLLDDNLIVMWVRELLKSHTTDAVVKARPPGSRLAIKA